MGNEICHPKTFLSKPEEKRLQGDDGSSDHAQDETILRWPVLEVRGNLAIRCPFISNSRIDRLSCGMAMIPFRDTESRLTGESARIVVKADLIFLSSHTFTVRSSDPEINLSSLAKTAEVTLLEQDN